MSRKRDGTFGLANTKRTGHDHSPVEQLSRALSDPTRLKIISILSTGSKSLDATTKDLKFDKKKKPNVRKHLQKLEEVNLIFRVKIGNYCLLCPELTSYTLRILENAWIELDKTRSSLIKARKAYNRLITEETEENRRDFEVKFDKIFKTNIFSQIGGQLRARYIDMAQNRRYDFSRLREV